MGSFVLHVYIARPTLRYWYVLCGLCSVLVFIILFALRFINSFCYSLCFFLVFLMCAVSQCRLRFVYSVLLCGMSVTCLVFILWTGAFCDVLCVSGVHIEDHFIFKM